MVSYIDIFYIFNNWNILMTFHWNLEKKFWKLDLIFFDF